jgi:hypothetical protein
MNIMGFRVGFDRKPLKFNGKLTPETLQQTSFNTLREQYLQYSTGRGNSLRLMSVVF